MFRRRAQDPSAPVALLDDVDRLRVAEWCQMAVDRVQAGPRATSWLTDTIMVQMTLGYAANARNRVPPLAYALITRTGYVLRMLVGHIAPLRPLDVSSIDPASIVKQMTRRTNEFVVGTERRGHSGVIERRPGSSDTPVLDVEATTSCDARVSPKRDVIGERYFVTEGGKGSGEERIRILDHRCNLVQHLTAPVDRAVGLDQRPVLIGTKIPVERVEGSVRIEALVEKGVVIQAHVRDFVNLKRGIQKSVVIVWMGCVSGRPEGKLVLLPLSVAPVANSEQKVLQIKRDRPILITAEPMRRIPEMLPQVRFKRYRTFSSCRAKRRGGLLCQWVLVQDPAVGRVLRKELFSERGPEFIVYLAGTPAYAVSRRAGAENYQDSCGHNRNLRTTAAAGRTRPASASPRVILRRNKRELAYCSSGATGVLSGVRCYGPRSAGGGRRITVRLCRLDHFGEDAPTL